MSCPHFKSEVKTEEEDLISRTGGYLCPACGEQLFYEKYFIEHIRERHYKPDLQVQEQDEEQSLFSEFTEGSVYNKNCARCFVVADARFPFTTSSDQLTS